MELADFHAGGIVTVQAVPDDHLALTAGADGSVRCYNYTLLDVQSTMKFSRRFNSPVTATAYMPKPRDETLRYMLLGFQDGVVRIVLRCSDGFKLLAALKPHRAPVAVLAVDGKHLATIGEDGAVFFFNLSMTIKGTNVTPIAYTHITGHPSCAAWDSRGKNLVIGCLSGEIYEITAPETDTVDVSKTFEVFDLPTRQFQFKRIKPKPPKKKEKAKKKKEEGERGEEGEGKALGITPCMRLALRFLLGHLTRIALFTESMTSYDCWEFHHPSLSSRPVL